MQPDLILEFLFYPAHCGSKRADTTVGDRRAVVRRVTGNWWSRVPDKQYLDMLKVASLIEKRRGSFPGLVVCTHSYLRFQDTSDVVRFNQSISTRTRTREPRLPSFVGRTGIPTWSSYRSEPSIVPCSIIILPPYFQKKSEILKISDNNPTPKF